MHLFNIPIVYSSFHKPLAYKKIVNGISSEDLENSKDILDLGCGPGTACSLFLDKNYLGVDLNKSHIEFAKNEYGNLEFLNCSAADLTQIKDRKFDFILINSILHHLDDAEVADVLLWSSKLLKDKGTVHIIELAKPENFDPLVSLFVYLDQGNFVRTEKEWDNFIEPTFKKEKSLSYGLKFLKLPLWKLYYLKLSLC